MILYIENPKDFTKNMRTNTLSKVVEEKSIYKNQLHFYALTTNCHEEKLRKQFYLHLHENE